MADFTRTITTELDNHQQFEAELQAAQTLAGEIEEAVRDLNTWRTNLPERYAGVADLYKTDGMNANVALMREEQGIGDTERQVRSLRSRLQLLHYAVDRARNGVKDSDASSGRVETAIGS